MATHSQKSSFSPRRRWGIAFNVALLIVVVLALVVMANYLSGRYFKRFYFSSNTRIELSPRTTSLLRSITNDIQVTLYYDKDEELFGDVSELLQEYHSTNPKISIRTLDYLRDPGAAMDIKAKYNLGASTNRNFVIFECEGRVKLVSGETLMQTVLEQVPSEDPYRPEFIRKPVAFHGETMFTSGLLAVLNPNPLKVYFLQGHGEHSPTDDSSMGFLSFVKVLQQNYVEVAPIELLGTNDVPQDCNLLIIPGARDPIPPVELERITKYLKDGGRLWAMFNVASTNQQTGLETILRDWGVEVGNSTVLEQEGYTTVGTDVIVGKYNTKHPVVNPLALSRLQMILPRPVKKLESAAENEDFSVLEIAYSSDGATLRAGGPRQAPQSYPLMVAVEASPKVVTPRGTTRILVFGDSIFLGNRQIESGANRDFANYAATWLLDRDIFAQGVGPRPVTEFRLMITKTQMQSLQWILLGAMPGGILLFGGLIWLTRRK